MTVRSPDAPSLAGVTSSSEAAPEEERGASVARSSPVDAEGERHADVARREAFRDETVAAIPASYSPTIHLLAPAMFAVTVFAVCVGLVRDLRAAELWTIPITSLAGFGFEWRVHKSILHKRIPGLSELYVRHELHHHVIYTYDDMTMRARREWRLVLMPAYAIVLVFGMLVPLGAGVWKLLGANVALLFVATSMVFFATYEWLHLAYHLPPEHPVSRVGWLRSLRELHRRHHDPRLMKRWNFNVTVPLFDWLHGTAWSEERERIRRENKLRRYSA